MKIKKKTKVKKCIFYSLIILSVVTVIYHVLSMLLNICMTLNIHFVLDILNKAHMTSLFFSDKMLYPVMTLHVITILTVILSWVFYRKETTLQMRIALSLCALCVIGEYTIPSALHGILLFALLGIMYITIGIFLINGLIKYSKPENQKMTVE